MPGIEWGSNGNLFVDQTDKFLRPSAHNDFYIYLHLPVKCMAMIGIVELWKTLKHPYKEALYVQSAWI